MLITLSALLYTLYVYFLFIITLRYRYYVPITTRSIRATVVNWSQMGDR